MAEPKKVRFHYIKSPHFSTVHVDGAIGGPTPRGDFHMSLYSERAAIPQQTEFFVKEDGSLGEAVPDGEVSRGGVVREMQVDAIMSKDVAKNLHDWLGRLLQGAEKPGK